MRSFVHAEQTHRVVFGTGAVGRLAEEVDRAGLRRLVVVCSPEQEATVAELVAPLGDRVAGLHPYAVGHVPRGVADEAVTRAVALRAGGCLAIGGGSAVGLAKAVARDTGLPTVAVPTTYAGSEMTPVWGVTDGARKTTGRDPRVRPAVVVYDPDLTRSLPVAVSVTSGVNAIAHAAEALYAPDCSPVTALTSAEAVRAIAGSLPRIAAEPLDPGAREEALYGAWLAGAALGATTMSLHHKLCHVLGGAFDLPHASVHTAVLPHVLALNLPRAPRAHESLTAALDTTDPAGELFRLARDLGAEMSLAALGLPRSGIGPVIDQVLASPYANPAVVSREDLSGLLDAASAGRAPH